MESKEIIEDQLVSIISKDYLDVFSKNFRYSSFNKDLYVFVLLRSNASVAFQFNSR